ncbi:hypothetical protein [Acetobacter pasteurianus]|uniref:hypothetical protein n=1 Tax=Acetobacter pasteurianus TaxID=438 RepID=UPI00056F1B9F|nr:hypothetical protein [Acetobacter pasteurianus]
MAGVEIKIDTKGVQKALSDLSEKGIKDALAFTLNTLGKASVSALRSEMDKVFDMPTPFTMNAFYTKPAKANHLEATIEAREFASKGTPAGQYLKPQIFGGTRPLKKFEKALAPLSGGQYVIPGPGATLDAYGNMSRGQIVQILSRLQVMRDPSQNVSVKTLGRLRKQKKNARGQQTEYFIGRAKGNGRPTGVYKLVGKGQVVPVLWFVQKAPNYGVRLKFDEVVQNTVDREAAGIMQSAIRGAINRGFKR